MLLTDLVETYKGDLNPDITGLTQDSRQVRNGYLFAALSGSKQDGARFIDDAIYNGAAAILATQDHDHIKAFEETGQNVAFVHHDNPRHALALMAAKFYDRQPETIIAVTGTNGKTSVADFALQLWTALGVKAASLGTLGVRGAGAVRSGSLTTPDPVSLHAELADLASSGVSHLAMEASSHGLHQNRLDGVKVSAAGFTNLSHDHLDYHKTMDDYLIAKAHLFQDILRPGGTAVLNADIPEYNELADRARKRGCKICSYGKKGEDIALKELTPVPQGQRLAMEVAGKDYNITIPLVGAFQAMNTLCALGLVLAEDDVSAEDVIGHLENLHGVPGRLEYVPGHDQAAVYVDYAHTPDALENVLKALRPHTTGRLVCLVGCGGDRDPHKRSLMGRIAAELADIAVLTDDNPRSEDPSVIRAAMLTGAQALETKNIHEIEGRQAAIKWAVNELQTGDVLVVAGKGHEQGQIIGDKVEPFDDVTEVENAFRELKKVQKGN